MKMFIAQSQPLIHQLKERHNGTFAVLDTIRFWTFKELVNARSCISCYLMRRLDKKNFEIPDRQHYHPRLYRQPTMNLSLNISKYLVENLLKFHS